MIRTLAFICLTLLLINCSGGKASLYREGDMSTRDFRSLISSDVKPKTAYYAVSRNRTGKIVSAKHYDASRHLLEKSSYSYTRQGKLRSHRQTEYFYHGPPRVAKEWLYEKDRIVLKEEKWSTRSRSLEKRITTHFDSEQKPYLEETWGLGRKVQSSTEYYYDYKHRLDKSRRNFFNTDGSLRDYWLTIYNDEAQITNEEHYFANNDLIAFYRYSYHPVHGYRESEEVLEETTDRFFSRKFDIYGLILEEEVRSRNLELISLKRYEYTESHKPNMVYQYNGQGILLKTSKYKNAIYIQSFRTPGL